MSLSAETAKSMGWLSPQNWQYNVLGHVLKRSCPAARTDLGVGDVWHLRNTLKLGHPGRLHLPSGVELGNR